MVELMILTKSFQGWLLIIAGVGGLSYTLVLLVSIVYHFFKRTTKKKSKA